MKQIALRKIIGDGNTEVFLANADGSNLRNLSNYPSFDGWPAWLPGGQTIASACHRRGQTKKGSAIQWKPSDCTSPLMLPEGLYDLAQFGKRQYRIDGKMSAGHFDCIYFIFQPSPALNPEAVAGATESSFMVKDTKVIWRSYKTIVEGRPVIRKEAVMPNILPHEKQGNSSDYIWIRVDADSQPILDQLTPAAEEILRDLAQPQS